MEPMVRTRYELHTSDHTPPLALFETQAHILFKNSLPWAARMVEERSCIYIVITFHSGGKK